MADGYTVFTQGYEEMRQELSGVSFCIQCYAEQEHEVWSGRSGDYAMGRRMACIEGFSGKHHECLDEGYASDT